METFDNTEWALLYSTNEIYKADFLIEMLEDNGILTQIMNRKDSNFGLGEIEIYVSEKDFNLAKTIIDQHSDL